MKSKSNYSFPWLDNLLSYFLNIKEIDDEIELIRVSLCEISQFSPISLFDYLDIDSKSFITLNDFKSFLRSQNSTYDEQKLRKMIHNFDKDSDFSLNLDEFIGFILPRKNEVLQKNILSIVNSYNQRDCRITQEMKSNLNDLILREMKLIKELSEISAKIKNSKIFSSYEAFLAIVGDDNYMTKSNLFLFLKKNGANIIDNEVAQLMFRLDADNDDRISYEEFKEIFYPLKEDFVYIQKNNIFNENDKYNINKKYTYFNNNDNKDEFKVNYADKNIENNEYGYNNDFNNDEKEDDKTNDAKPKKEKKTKKVILKPGKNSNLLYSQETKNNELMNNPQESSYSKFPNVNNNNSTDNYTLKNKISKYNNYTFSKNYENKKPTLNEDNNNEYEYNSNTQENLIINNNNNNNPLNKYKFSSKKYKYISSNNNNNNYDMEESKYPDYDSNGINNYENNTILRRRNKRFFSPNNDYENNHIHNTDNCKGCLYSAKNIYNHYKTKKYKNFSNTIDNDNFNAFDNKKRNDYKLKNNKRNDINKYTQLNDYYRIKEELLRKYGNLQKDRNNYFFSSEEDNPSSKNRYFSSPREALLIHNDNNYVNEINNWNDNANKYDNINNEEKEINTSNSKSNINPSSSSSLIKNDKNSKKNTFAERYNRIKENKETKGCKNCSSSPKFRDLKKDNIKGNNIKDKKDLLYKLFVDFIDQDLKLEEIKESLSKCQDASLPKIFELFNRNKKNKINSSDLYEVLNSLSRKETFKPNEMKYIFKKYNKSTEIGFNYEDFGNIILPKKASAKISMENRKTNINDELEHDTIGKILELFETLIDGEKSNEEIRSMINMTVDNIFYDLFGEIKKENKPGIQNDDIDKFMKENGYDIKNYEIEIIMEKMDKNRDSIIDYEEFISELQPKIV